MTRPVPRWVRVRRDFPRATSTGRFWCRADGESHPWPSWVARTAAHRAYAAHLTRVGSYDTRWRWL